jgi:adenosylcobinamide kinase/adenosylcobinamide-phosphate guanylyltransferase
MDLHLAGTGPATGFPVPGCGCAACAVGAAGALSPRTASRSVGLPPRRPAQLRLGGDAPAGYRFDVDGVVHDRAGQSHPLRPGDRLERPGITVHALGRAPGAAGPALLIRADEQPPVLWAPQAGQLSTPVVNDLAGTELGFAILGPAAESDPTQPLADRPPLLDCAVALAQLRRAGSVTGRTECLLIGAGHRQGDPAWLTACLAHWGARAPLDQARFDGTRFDGLNARPTLGGRTLVLGGAASGKSSLAEHLLTAEPEVLYTATGPIVDLRSRPDAEWAERVSRHRERRPSWWQTEETHEVAALLAKAEQPVLLDSIGTWLTGVLDRAGAWPGRPGWRLKLAAETDDLIRAWRARRAPLVAVTDEVGWGVVPATVAGRLFRDELGRLNRRLADESERVLVVVAGRVLSAGPAVAPTAGREPQ